MEKEYDYKRNMESHSNFIFLWYHFLNDEIDSVFIILINGFLGLSLSWIFEKKFPKFSKTNFSEILNVYEGCCNSFLLIFYTVSCTDYALVSNVASKDRNQTTVNEGIWNKFF